MSTREWLDHHARQGDWTIRTPPTDQYVDYIHGSVEVRTEFDRQGGLVWLGRYEESTLVDSYDAHDRGKREIATGWLSKPAAQAQPVKVEVSLKAPDDGLSLHGPVLYEVWLPGGFMAGHVGVHGTRWRRYSPRTNRMAGEYYGTAEGAAKALAARWGDNADAAIEIVDHTPAREEPQP